MTVLGRFEHLEGYAHGARHTQQDLERDDVFVLL